MKDAQACHSIKNMQGTQLMFGVIKWLNWKNTDMVESKEKLTNTA